MDKEKFDQFASLEDLSSLAKLLGFRKGTLAYILYGRDRDLQYKAFKLSKKNGGERQIEAPITALKTVQWRLCRILEDVYWRRPSAFGFVKGHSIKDNAKRHCNKKYVFNLDLENFFHSIHFGRVRGLFASQPFSLPLGVATIIAQICCYKGRLPQGAPTSPVISNMICTKLDWDLQNLAKSCRSHYTRYADDITFSMNDVTNVEKIWGYENKPFNLFRTLKKLIIRKDQKTERNVVVGKELNDIVISNGFVINSKKVRLASYKERQEVTGLVVNKFPNVRRDYIRRTRAILHSWKTYGIEKASEKFFNDEYVWNGKGERPPFESIIRGRIEYVGMIRGKDDPVYLKQLREFFYLTQGKIPEKSESRFRLPLDDKRKYVITEGKTDWKHIRAAVTDLCRSGVVKSFEPYLYEYEEGEPAGDMNMLERCRALGRTNSGEKRLFVFDNDNPQIVKQAVEKGKTYKHWGNGVYSILLPVPDFRKHNDVSIEFLYTDKDLSRLDDSKRRLFISSEFYESGRHRNIENIEYGINPKTGNKISGWPSKLKGAPKILDQNVVQINDGGGYTSIALSKNAYASNIMARNSGFEDIDFGGFKPLLDLINEVMDL